MHHFLHGEVAQALNEGALNLSNVDCRVQTPTHVHHNVSPVTERIEIFSN